jgi:DNA topoisomerase-1
VAKQTNNLVIVESAAKARTLEKFLGRNFSVRASMGHVRGLPKSKLGVKVEDEFSPEYVVPKEKREIVKKLKEQAKGAAVVFLATDPDREGEAIAWHLVQAIGLDRDSRQVRRVEFHEVTRNAVLEAIAHPREIDSQRVSAQQARRVLDRLVGYKLSPILWRKVRRGLSAGRVQSVAVRMIVEREREIQDFQPEEYWSLEAELAKRSLTRRRSPQTFRAALVEKEGEKAELGSHEDVARILADLEGAAYRVTDVRQREQTRNPAAPFTTSTLQQEASRKLNFTAKRTMAVAQQLYEGVELGGKEGVGLITYMRTDSTNVASTALDEARQFIGRQYGPELLPDGPRVYRTRSRLAQEAHEAIRPTSVFRVPGEVKPYLTSEQFRLYDLIWKRFVASQMASAVFDVTTVDVEAASPGRPRYLFRATGSRLKFAGFISIYREGRDDDEVDDEGRAPLPPLESGEQLDLLQLLPEQHFTQPPPRYSEATLVKSLEEKGIGRPSTYAPTISTIQERGYVQRLDRRLFPTELGMLVNDLLVEHFAEIVDVDFTAVMEDKLDEIARGERPWVPVVREFYTPFEQDVERANEVIPKVSVPAEVTDERCEKCGRPMAIKIGRFGKFLACTGFPECRSAKAILSKIGVSCPKCGSELVERRSRKGRLFYGCSGYPQCDWVSWNRPVNEPCPRCGGLQVIVAKDKLRCLSCEGEPEPVPRRRAAAAGRSRKAS